MTEEDTMPYPGRFIRSLLVWIVLLVPLGCASLPSASSSGPAVASAPSATLPPPSPTPPPSPSPVPTLAPDAVVAGVNVGGMTRDAAIEHLDNSLAPLRLPLDLHADSASTVLRPTDIDLRIPLDALLDEALALQAAGDTVRVPLQVRFDKAALREQLAAFAQQSSISPTRRLVVSETDPISRSFVLVPGQRFDVEHALPRIADRLSTPQGARRVTLEMQPAPDMPPPRPDFARLQQEVEALAAEWEGIAGIYLYDLQSEQTVTLNADTVFSAASIMKVAILLHAYTQLDTIDDELQGHIEKMLIESDNMAANDVLAASVLGRGTDDALDGVIAMSDMLEQLGFEYTYMNMPYEGYDYLVGLQGIAIEYGPPREGNPPYTASDPLLRTTPAEISRLFLLIEECRQGSGLLLDQFERLTPDRCQNVFDLLARNADTERIVAGIPSGVRIEHKSGWVQDMHADAAIVRSPGGEYLLTIYLWRGVDELPGLWANPYIEALSRLIYTAYNPARM
jgi:beta-lactamase class A